MTKVAYITNQRKDPLMNSLGLEVFHYQPKTHFESFLKDLVYKDYSLIYVSEKIYKEYQHIIDKIHDDTVIITVLSSQNSYSRIGRRRMESLLEKVVGISTQQGGH